MSEQNVTMYNTICNEIAGCESVADVSKKIAGVYDRDNVRVHVIVMEMENGEFKYIFDPESHARHTGGQDKSNGLYHVEGHIADEKSLKKYGTFASLEKMKANFNATRNRVNQYVAEANGLMQLWLKQLSELIDKMYGKLQKIDKIVDNAILDEDEDE